MVPGGTGVGKKDTKMWELGNVTSWLPSKAKDKPTKEIYDRTFIW